MTVTSQARTTIRKYLSWYWFPILGSVFWIVTLLTLLITWIAEGSPIYESMDPSGQTIAYISDIGADRLKPLFITGSSITSVCFVLSLSGARWLRHRGRILPNTSMTQTVCSIVSIIGAVIGGAGLILLAVFDTRRYTTLHRVFLAVFCGGVLISAFATVLEYWRLQRNHRTSRAIRISMWTKLVFFVVEFGLAIAFGMLLRNRNHNAGAITEWVLAVLFTGYLLSFNLDLIPAARSYTGQFKDVEIKPLSGTQY